MYNCIILERLRLTSQAVKHPQPSPFYSVSLIRVQGKKVVSSTVILETQAAWHLPSTTVSTDTVVQFKLSSYVTWSTSEAVASVQLPLNAVFFCLAEVVSHVILCRQCSRSMYMAEDDWGCRISWKID